jgi:hypothetical protein
METPSIHFLELPPDAQQQIAPPEPAINPDAIREAVLSAISVRDKSEISSDQHTVATHEVVLPALTERQPLLTKIGTSRFGRWAVRAAIGLGLVGGPIAIDAVISAPAYANTQTYSIQDGPWYIHASSPTIHSETVGFADAGDTISLSCHETGEMVDGDAEWDVITDLTNGLRGVIADKATTTPVTMPNEKAELTALGIGVVSRIICSPPNQ